MSVSPTRILPRTATSHEPSLDCNHCHVTLHTKAYKEEGFLVEFLPFLERHLFVLFFQRLPRAQQRRRSLLRNRALLFFLFFSAVRLFFFSQHRVGYGYFLCMTTGIITDMDGWDGMRFFFLFFFSIYLTVHGNNACHRIRARSYREALEVVRGNIM